MSGPVGTDDRQQANSAIGDQTVYNRKGLKMTREFQKAGGFSAIAMAACYLIGFAMFIFVLDSSGYSGPSGSVAFAADHAFQLFLTMLVIYVLASLFLIVLLLALNDRLKAHAPVVMQTATAVGIIWAAIVLVSGMLSILGADSVTRLAETDPERAATVWLAIGIVQNVLGGGTEFVGGVWITLVSLTGLRHRGLPRALNLFGLVIGLAGIVTIYPDFEPLNAVFGLSQIVWFLGVGVVMLPRKSCELMPSAA